ncbi:hypothetical protein [Stenotrophomonas maltophilia]|nr:hypothetical protein [Stenotrophomonas maltophilia]MBH1417147.1 hypothetical protein [Stenotrophomonas maltophilia]MDZ5773271.1 hypothetical protein [Stenotrophomonas maltophilia]HDS1569303.1 hypothetical protein [Stenotrophomonas maltophilia]HDS1591418.1 hypothetical protein [Stenotrophomonas maltophilia]
MKWLKDKIFFIVAIGGFSLLVGGCVRWQWNECRGVGHGVLYCIHDMGSR